jgi:anti-sigma factor RsiW
MTCEDFEKRLFLVLDGEREDASFHEIAVHVAGCPSCETTLREYESFQHLYGEAVEAEAGRGDPEILWTRIVEGLASPRRPRPIASIARPVGWVVAAGLAAGVAIWSLAPYPGAPPPERAPVASRREVPLVAWSDAEEYGTTSVYVASYDPADRLQLRIVLVEGSSDIPDGQIVTLAR